MNKTPSSRVQPNSTVTLHFSLTLADGTPVDGTADGEPMTFTMGDGSLIPAFEEVLIGLSPGDKQQVSLEPRETFGFPDEANQHWMKRADFDQSIELEEGLLIEFATPAGDQLPGIILEITDDKVLVDFNHPLAGHEIIFAVEVMHIS